MVDSVMAPRTYRRVEQLSECLGDQGWRRLLLVTDAEAYDKSGIADRLPQALGHRIAGRFDSFQPNPRLDDLLEGLETLRAARPDAVLAVGGGSAIDMAKLIAWFASQAERLSRRELIDRLADQQRLAPRRVGLVVVPTTAGTGSEATQFAVLYVDHHKYSATHATLVPDAAVLDASLTESLPPGVTAVSGLDAAAQAIESLWSVRSTVDSMRDADEALRLALGHLETAVTRPSPDDRAAMLRASHLAGRAINVSRTTAPHALSYALTIRYGVPHGAAVAVFMKPVMRFNQQISPDNLADHRGVGHVRDALARIASAFGIDDPRGGDAMERVARCWESLLGRIGVGHRLRDYGIRQAADRAVIADSVNTERLANNPRLLGRSDVESIVESIA